VKKSLRKPLRILSLYERLSRGDLVRKQELADEFGVDPKTIYYDIRDLRAYLSELDSTSRDVTFDRKKQGYLIERDCDNWLEETEVLALAKVLLESRAFTKEETKKLLDKLIMQSSPESRKTIKDLIANELIHYVPLENAQPLIEKIWDLCGAIHRQQIVEIIYNKVGAEKPVKRNIKPLSVIFSEYYFYLLAAMEDREFAFPTIYRLDRIIDYTITDRKYKVIYAERFEEGIFRKQVQFMQSGELRKVKFRFWGESIEAILDRLPTARILSQEGDIYTVEAEVFGRGILMWLLSQGPTVEILAPAELRSEMMEKISAMSRIYNRT